MDTNRSGGAESEGDRERLEEVLRCGWAGDVEQFLSCARSDAIASLAEHHVRCMLEPAGESQKTAWSASIAALSDALKMLVASRPEAGKWGVVLEYELPRERGRRPDTVILAPGRVLVLEFKGHSVAREEYLDQVEAYARDLSEYHAASRDLRVIPVLVLRGQDGESRDQRAHVIAASELGELVVDQLEIASGSPPDVRAWIQSEYAPLPTLVAAARAIFRHEPLPAIRRAQSAGIPQALAALIDATVQAESKRQRHLAFVTGVPGAGKTLVGLQFVYSSRGEESAKEAVFLSGNGPLVKVLQHALKSGVFVQDVHGFLKEYGGKSKGLPSERIWIYDEAQRAWDADRAFQKRGHLASEPDDFLRLGARVPDWCMVVGLIGEGQEIHLGEEAGIIQWNEAIASNPARWHVHCPPRLANLFPAAEAISQQESLDLTVSLRSHLARDVQDWVRELLRGNLDQANTAASRAQQAGYVMYLTDNLDRASEYVRRRYEGAADSRYGLIASSKAKNLMQHGVRNEFSYTRRFREGPWFNDDPTSPHSCCQLKETATEFQCQGLELDCPLVCWGDDLWWDGSSWRSKVSMRSKAKAPHMLRLNSYRVLLSRGRDGVVVFCPPEIP